MDEQFWHERWAKNDIGFHLDEPHHLLRHCFGALEIRPGDTCLVPLCGKSPDLAWLHAQQLEVVGVELSRLAIEAFIDGQGLSGSWATTAGLPCFQADRYRLFCGDFFRLGADGLPGLRAAYDRGSLVALPPKLRQRYATHLAALMPSGSRTLAISYTYDQAETHGPPFSVPFPELCELFGADFHCELLVEEDALASHRGLAKRGVTELTEFAVLLRRK